LSILRLARRDPGQAGIQTTMSLMAQWKILSVDVLLETHWVTKRTRYLGLTHVKEYNADTYLLQSLGPGMVKRRAPKRDPSLPLLKNNTGMTSGQHIVPGSIGTSEGSKYDAEYPMKMKIRDLEDEISALETSKQKTVSDIRDDESEMVSIHNKIELLQVQKQKIQQSRREKEGQLGVYSTKIEKLNSQKKHLEVAVDIVRGSD